MPSNTHKTLLIDLDGVLRQDENLLPHAVGFLHFLQQAGIPFCILSNTTRYPAAHIRSFFASKDPSLDNLPILTALDATAAYVAQHYASYAVYCEEQAKTVFDKTDDSLHPGAVVTGDLGSGWTFSVLNRIFHQLRNGADLVAMQMNRYGKNSRGELELDAGAFVSALEYATEKKATLIGKPSPVFFLEALKKTGTENPRTFFMLGDDLNADIAPAMKLGGKGVLLLTGKTSREMVAQSPVQPDFIAKDLKEAQAIIEKSIA